MDQTQAEEIAAAAADSDLAGDWAPDRSEYPMDDNAARKPDDEEEEVKYRFGCGPCKPKCLQKIFRNSIFFLVILCLYSTLQGAVASGT